MTMWQLGSVTAAVRLLGLDPLGAGSRGADAMAGLPRGGACGAGAAPADDFRWCEAWQRVTGGSAW